MAPEGALFQFGLEFAIIALMNSRWPYNHLHLGQKRSTFPGGLKEGLLLLVLRQHYDWYKPNLLLYIRFAVIGANPPLWLYKEAVWPFGKLAGRHLPVLSSLVLQH